MDGIKPSKLTKFLQRAVRLAGKIAATLFWGAFIFEVIFFWYFIGYPAVSAAMVFIVLFTIDGWAEPFIDIWAKAQTGASVAP